MIALPVCHIKLVDPQEFDVSGNLTTGMGFTAGITFYPIICRLIESDIHE